MAAADLANVTQITTCVACGSSTSTAAASSGKASLNSGFLRTPNKGICSSIGSNITGQHVADAHLPSRSAASGRETATTMAWGGALASPRRVIQEKHLESWSCAHWVSDVKRSPSGSSRSVFRFGTPSSSISVLPPGTLGLCTKRWIPGRRGSWRAKFGGEGTENLQESDSATDVAPKESKLGGAKGFGTPPKALVTEKKRSSKSSSSGSIRRAPPSKPLIGVQGTNPQTQQIENAIVASLTLLFALILLEGLVLAASGFLPDDWDQFATNSLYPAFTPSVGLFLAGAAGYGVWKYFQGGPGTSGG